MPDSVPGSRLEETCLLEGVGAIPRYWRLYVFKKVVRRGKDDSVGSFESW